MEQNLSTADRYFRLATGIISIASATGQRKQSTWIRTALLSFGAMKVAEGVTGWCPMQHMSQLIKQTSPSQKPKQQQTSNDNTRSSDTSNRKHHNDKERDSNTPDFVSYLMDQDDQYGRTQ